jgi:hypothetical protein
MAPVELKSTAPSSKDIRYTKVHVMGHGVIYGVTVDHQSLIGLHAHSCTQPMKARTPRRSVSFSPINRSYTKTLLVSQNRRHLFVTPLGKGFEKRDTKHRMPLLDCAALADTVLLKVH